MPDGLRKRFGPGRQGYLVQLGSIYCDCSVSTHTKLDLVKKCTKCRLIKSKEEFLFRRQAADKLTSHCRECDREYCRKRYAKLKERNGGLPPRPRNRTRGREGVKGSEADWKMINMYWRAKKRSKKRGRIFDIKQEDVFALYVERCPIFDIELDWEVEGLKRAFDNSPSLDRIDSSKGYVKGNIWIISVRANRIKNDASAEELMAIAQALMSR